MSQLSMAGRGRKAHQSAAQKCLRLTLTERLVLHLPVVKGPCLQTPPKVSQTEVR